MGPFLNFEGKNVEQAAQEAAEKLKIPLSKLKYDVISYGSTGIFGLVGTKKAKIRVLLNEKHVSPADETNEETESPQEAIKAEPSGAETETGKEEAVDIAVETRSGSDTTVDATEERIAVAKEVLEKIIHCISPEAVVTCTTESRKIMLNIQCAESAVLIGKRGQTLEALQYLVERIVYKRTQKAGRLEVDIEGYLKSRRDNLEQTALRLAETAKRTGKPKTIGQMNAYDRKIVHLALKNDLSVRTQSLGEGFYRKLVIFPKKSGTITADTAKAGDDNPTTDPVI